MMRTIGLWLSCGLLMLGFVSAQKNEPEKKGTGMKKKSLLDFTMKTIDGVEKPLSDYRGQVLLIVNTASECGYTPQYESLQKLYETYRDRGFRILAFPSNDFGGQEPGTDAVIKKFCTTRYKTTFDLFSKITVKGKNIHPLYALITQAPGVAGDVKWNFQKYLVDRSGTIVSKFMSAVDPMTDEFRSRVDSLLSRK
jgi:glutathione peroxidase